MIDRDGVDRQVVVRRDEQNEHEELREQLAVGSYVTIFRVIDLDVSNALIEQPLEVLLGANALLAVAGHARQATDVLDDATCSEDQHTGTLGIDALQQSILSRSASTVVLPEALANLRRVLPLAPRA